MTQLPTVKAHLVEGIGRMGLTPYWVVDEGGRQLNTEPVCLVPDKCHEWFKAHLEQMEFEYWGLPGEGDR